MPDWFYTVAWIFMFLWFAVIESAALFDKDPGDTLSEHLRKWLGTRKDSPIWHRIIGWTVFVGFWVWFIPHILLGG